MLSRKQHSKSWLKTSLMLTAGAATLAMAPQAYAQSSGDEVIVTGIRQSLENALVEKRNADSLVEVILSEDIGKLPDQNLAEVLENITGIQITRTAGVGTGVQIRGTNANRIEINGVSTVGSGSGRSGIDFEDVNASIIAGVEVIKSPEASTIEGSVGGTVNLRTIRPLDLKKPLASVRVQGEDTNLTSGISPRVSGAVGQKWVNDSGQEFGFVLSGSYTEQEATSFRPRADADSLTTRPGEEVEEFLTLQFLVQEQEQNAFETINLAGTVEWAPTDELSFHVDAILNDQERAQQQYRLEASGIAGVNAFPGSTPEAFETVDFGVGPGEFQRITAGILEPDLSLAATDPNLRFTSETNSRVTRSEIISVGADWERDNITASIEYANTSSDTETPTLNTTLNFINPNCPVNNNASDNCVPFVFDLRDETLSFGINFDSAFAPDPEDLTNPENVVLARLEVGRDTQVNKEEAFRADLSYDFADHNVPFISSVDVGYRYNESSSVNEEIGDRVGRFNGGEDTPDGTNFASLLVNGPTNFDAADGRDLFIEDFLIIDPEASFNDPDGTFATLQGALTDFNPDPDNIVDPNAFDQNAFFDVSEQTHAIYGQVNLEHGIFRGNAGLRYIDTEVTSVAFGPVTDGTRELEATRGSYDFFLPRVNLIANVRDDIVLRAAYSEDIRRPNFDDLNTSFTFPAGENGVVALGNPGLVPEAVESFDVSAEWYFAPASVISIGWFTKDRTNIFGSDSEGALQIPNDTPAGFQAETDPNCPGGGIFNPDVIPGVLGDPNIVDQVGLCVGFTTPGNDPETTTQSGFEFAFQTDLSPFEDRIGWASGFGVIANYTNQKFSGGSATNSTFGRGLNVLGEVTLPEGLLDFSEDAYNITGFYEKFGLSARLRYTWRDDFRTNDFGGGAGTSGSSTFSFPVVTEARGQFNGSVSYDVTDKLTVGIEGVNLTKANIVQRCVADTGPVCFVGLPDRRIIFGASYTF